MADRLIQDLINVIIPWHLARPGLCALGYRMLSSDTKVRLESMRFTACGRSSVIKLERLPIWIVLRKYHRSTTRSEAPGVERPETTIRLEWGDMQVVQLIEGVPELFCGCVNTPRAVLVVFDSPSGNGQ